MPLNDVKQMNTELPPISPRRRRQRGHTMLEGSLIMIPFFAFFLAIIDFGLAIFVRNLFQHAVREAVRAGVTYQLQAGMGHDSSIKQVVLNNSMGFLAAHPERIHIRYFDPNNNLLETASNRPGMILEVSVEGHTFGVLAPLMRSANPIPVDVRSSDRMESLPQDMALPPRT
ncbi:MAG: pilus assembly protein [Bryobacterales bacterium]|nr:pilus assembly protein [Bryobacterales bacterium]